MKKTFKILAGVALSLSLFSCASESGYKVSGDVKSLDGMVYLSVLEGKMPKVVDSLEVVDGKFEFSGSLGMPAYAQLQKKVINHLL